MEKDKATKEKSIETKKKDEIIDSISASQQPTGYSSLDPKLDFPSGYLSGGLSSQYEELLKTEKKLKEISERIKWYKEQLKPINRVERKRGIKSALTPIERKINKAMVKKLETERVTESENWKIQYAAFTEASYDEIERSINERYVELGRSGHYAKKYSGSIVTRLKTLLENVLLENFDELKKLNDSVVKSEKEKVSQVIYAFIKENEDNPFLSTFYISHKTLQPRYTKLITELLNEWNERSVEEYSFKNSDVKLEEEKKQTTLKSSKKR
jgi:hypothetical protein